jgi:hypothetical protein
MSASEVGYQASVRARDGRLSLRTGGTTPRVGFLSGGDEKGAESFVAAMLDGLQAEVTPSLPR